MLGKVPQVSAISAPSGSANDYAGFIIQEGIDSLLLEASQVFERVNVKSSDEHDKLFLQASQSYDSKHRIVSGMPDVPVTAPPVTKEKLLQVALLRVFKAVEKVRKSAVVAQLGFVSSGEFVTGQDG